MIMSKTINFIVQRRPGSTSQRPNASACQRPSHLAADISSIHWTHSVCHRLQLHEEHCVLCIHSTISLDSVGNQPDADLGRSARHGQLVDLHRSRYKTSTPKRIGIGFV